MTRRESGWLLVRAGERHVGLPLRDVVEVLDPGVVHPVPATERAVRGITSVRGGILPVVHLATLLDGGDRPATAGACVVVVELGGRRLCLEVDAAEEVLAGAQLAVARPSTLPWAAAVARHEGRLVPLLDLAALGSRITENVSA